MDKMLDVLDEPAVLDPLVEELERLLPPHPASTTGVASKTKIKHLRKVTLLPARY